MHNKVCGPATDFTLVKEEGTSTVISYDLKEEAGKELATWREIYFPKKQVAKPTIEMVKDAIIDDIDAQTEEKILDGYEFTPDGADTPIIVWLSKESQTNFSEAHRLQIVPVKLNSTRQPTSSPSITPSRPSKSATASMSVVWHTSTNV